jgi:hypothetical protein
MTEAENTNGHKSQEQERKICRNPSGIPPLSSEDLNASISLSTVFEESRENGGASSETPIDPPEAEQKASFDSAENNDMIEEEHKSQEPEQDVHHDEKKAPLPPQEPTTDARLPRGDTKETRTTRGDAILPSQNGTLQSTGSSPQQEFMPPDIIKAALQEEMPEMVPERQDEKKSDERREEADMIMPPPTRATMTEVTSSIPNQALTHSVSLPYPDQLYLPPPQQQMAAAVPFAYAPSSYSIPQHLPSGNGRRKITLRLQEDSVPSHARRPSFFFRNRDAPLDAAVAAEKVDRGEISVSWFEGTTSAELQEHVRSSLIRKMGIKGNIKLVDLRIIDETMDPPEEIVLSPFIPDGSHFLLRFSTKEKQALEKSHSGRNFASRYLDNQIASTAPESPSAAPSPHPSKSNLLNLSEDQLTLLSVKLKGLDVTGESKAKDTDDEPPLKRVSNKSGEDASRGSLDFNEEEVMSMHPDDQIEARMRQLTDLLINERRGKRDPDSAYRRQEKKQVVFVMANYFVLFLSIIAIMAEIQSRAPRWLEWAERNLESVQTCAMDQESLFQCVSNGDFSGLIASFLLWFGRSAATKRFFLFGFETPKRLWTVVYEALVTAFCWGISYMFIRRGMNPDTRQNFISKYWKDAVYGSLAGFNASFLKAVLKNLIPQEALEDALQERHLKILSFLPSFH